MTKADAEFAVIVEPSIMTMARGGSCEVADGAGGSLFGDVAAGSFGGDEGEGAGGSAGGSFEAGEDGFAGGSLFGVWAS